MTAWLKSTAGIITGIGLVILILVAYTKCDEIKAWNYNRHTAKADSALVVADTAHSEGIVARTEHEKLLNTPEVRNSVAAQKVVVSSNKVIAKADKEIAALRTTVDETKAAGEKPVPRAIPYIDVLGSVNADTTQMKMRMVIRAGIDYRILPHVFAKIEVVRDPNYRLNVGAHITFR